MAKLGMCSKIASSLRTLQKPHRGTQEGESAVCCSSLHTSLSSLHMYYLENKQPQKQTTIFIYFF